MQRSRVGGPTLTGVVSTHGPKSLTVFGCDWGLQCLIITRSHSESIGQLDMKGTGTVAQAGWLRGTRVPRSLFSSQPGTRCRRVHEKREAS